MKAQTRCLVVLASFGWLAGCNVGTSGALSDETPQAGASGGAGGPSASTSQTAGQGGISGAGGQSSTPPQLILGSGGASSGTSSTYKSSGAGGQYASGGYSSSGMGGAAGAMATGKGGATSAILGTGGMGMGGTSATGGTTVSNSGDKYQPVGTNPFVMTAHDPFSTFAADVDTASYDIFRRDAQLGQLPSPSSVRLEEYVNYFSYSYLAPLPGTQHPFRVSLAAANQVFDRGTALLRVGVQATEPPPFVKKPTNLVFLLDVSGSMADFNKLPLVKETILATLDQLDDSDRVSIVTYSSTAQVLVPPTSMEMRSTIASVVAGLAAGGSTAGADGMGLAYAQAAVGFIPEGINHIVMCTDGDFNVGPSSTTELLNMIREKRKTGVTLTVLGFGSGNLNDAMMEAVADAGNGIYSVIIDVDSARKYAQEKILSTITHVAKDMKLQVEFNPDRVVAYRLLGYEDRAIADQNFRNDAVDAGEVGAGHRVTALYEVVMAGGTVPVAAGAPVPDDGEPSTLPREVGPDDFVLVKIRYKTVDADETTPAIEMSTSMPVALLSDQLGSADADMQWATAVAALAEILKTSPYADKSFVPTIRAIAASQASLDADRAEFATLLEKIAGKL
jgi:Ca-activated chloride channel family protein